MCRGRFGGSSTFGEVCGRDQAKVVRLSTDYDLCGCLGPLGGGLGSPSLANT